MQRKKAYFSNLKAEEKLWISDKKCLLPISIGQKNQQGQELEATLRLINRSFGSCLVVLCDSLYRHTLMTLQQIPERKAYDEAISAGQQWLDSHLAIFEHLDIPLFLTRWDHWIFGSKSYIKYKNAIDYMHHNNTSFRHVLDESVNQFLLRYHKNNIATQINLSQQRACSLEYLKEECAAIVSIWHKENYSAISYPSNPILAVSQTIQCFINPKAKRPIYWLRPNFRRHKKDTKQYQLNTASNAELIKAGIHQTKPQKDCSI